MRVGILSGAQKNAGDYLIIKRSIELIKYVHPECEITVYNRNQSLEDYLDEMNQSDRIIFAGGPLLRREIYPKEMPLVKELGHLSTKFFTIGVGWYGKNNLESTLYEDYTFNDSTNLLIQRLAKDATISCRDWYTIRLLKNKGINNTIMTGCPAWYDLKYINQSHFSKEVKYPFRKICISDPGYSINMEKSYKVAEYIRKKFPHSDIIYIFHRGIAEDENTDKKRADLNLDVFRRLELLNIDVQDISYSDKGFELYDDCDLHIGFRVHAHIYNLSKRNISILIEEDARGIGVNEALGLSGIKPYFFTRNGLIDNDHFINSIDDLIFINNSNDYIAYKMAYKTLQKYFENMISHISKLEAE